MFKIVFKKKNGYKFKLKFSIKPLFKAVKNLLK